MALSVPVFLRGPTSLRQLRRVAWAWLGLAALLLCALVWLGRPAPEATAAPGAAPRLAPNDIVRIRLDRPDAPRPEDPWFDGRAVIAPLGCTLVLLAGRERELGAGSVRLAAVRELQRADPANGWMPLPLEALRSAEHEGCARA